MRLLESALRGDHKPAKRQKLTGGTLSKSAEHETLWEMEAANSKVYREVPKGGATRRLAKLPYYQITQLHNASDSPEVVFLLGLLLVRFAMSGDRDAKGICFRRGEWFRGFHRSAYHCGVGRIDDRFDQRRG